MSCPVFIKGFGMDTIAQRPSVYPLGNLRAKKVYKRSNIYEDIQYILKYIYDYNNFIYFN